MKQNNLNYPELTEPVKELTYELFNNTISPIKAVKSPRTPKFGQSPASSPNTSALSISAAVDEAIFYSPKNSTYPNNQAATLRNIRHTTTAINQQNYHSNASASP